jgi:hypothetical protein
LMPDARTISGLCEPMLTEEKPDRMVQLVRFGFGRIDEVKDESVRIYYTHN